MPHNKTAYISAHKSLSILFAAFTFWLSITSLAIADYRFFVAGAKSESSTKDYSSDTNTYIFSYYPNPVKSDQTPIAEAPFLQRSSRLMLRKIDSTSEYDLSENVSVILSSTIDGQSLDYTHASPESDLKYSVAYSELDYELLINNTILATQTTRTAYRFAIGKYYDKNTMLEYNLGYEIDEDFNGNKNHEEKDFFLSWRQVMTTQGEEAYSYILSLGTALREYSSRFASPKEETTHIISAEANWYFTKRLGLGAIFTHTISDSSVYDGTRLSVNGHHYYMNNLFLGIALEKFQAGKSGGLDTDSYLISLGYLF